MTDPILDDIRDNFWVRVFGGSKYVVLLYDVQGNPLWASGKGLHKHNEIVQAFLAGPIHQFYSLPVEGNLPELFRRIAETAKADPPFTDPVDPAVVSRLPGLRFPTFSSKNLVEGKTLAVHFVIRYPLSRIFLVRLTGERFAGVVTFPDIYGKLLSLENKTSVLVDDNHRILGLNSHFARPLKLKDPTSLLGRDLFDVVSFSRDPRLGPGLPDPGLFPSFRWSHPQEHRFKLSGSGTHRLIPGDSGLRWQHASGEDYGYLLLPFLLPVEESHFTLDIDYLPGKARIPRVIFRGASSVDPTSPDILGYALSGAPGDRELLFKKNTHPVKYLAKPVIREGAVNTLSIRKVFDTFTFYLNGTALGEWRETSPFIYPGEDLVYLFLRPEEDLTLTSMALSTAKADSKAVGDHGAPLTASFKPPADPLQFKASFFQGILENQNFFLYHFEDITSLKQDIENLKRERDSLATLLRHERGIVGGSPALQAIRSTLAVVAPSNLSVIIEGETGTGKEVVAKAVHAESGRKNGPFVKIDCSAIPAELIESELFGYEKGAFTGAAAAHPGRFEQADGGTVFLDEIGNLPLPVQAKLLHVLQDFEVHRLGGKKPLRVDVRVIAASNVALEKLLSAGRLRTDFFYRLNQYRFFLPPLRERREDIPPLVHHFLDEANASYKKSLRSVAREAMEKLCRAPWPGNVRELRNVILRAALFCRGDEVGERDVVLEERGGQGGPKGQRGRWGGMRKKVEISRADFRAALAAAKGNLAEAVRKLSISRSMAYKLLRQYKFRMGDFREG